MAKKKQESKGASKRKKLPEKYNKLLKVGVYDDTHRKQLQQRAKRVQQLYRQAVDKIARAAAPSLFDADPASATKQPVNPSNQRICGSFR